MSTEYTFDVEGMSCGSCAARIDEKLGTLAGVSSATTSVESATTVVQVDGGLSAEEIMTTIEDLGGFTATLSS